jgi:glycosyltransferase involved in cell wall biosynthesis
MKPPPFFSIVVPTYNRADLLGVAIESVLKQTYSDWELVIVDDGSTDNTAEVVKNYGDARIRYIYQTNAERSAARNNGIAQATGRYICFLDSDDYYLPERLILLFSEITKINCPVAMFYTGVMIDKNGKLSRQATDYKRYKDVFDSIAGNFIGCPQACISREILEEFKYHTGFRIGEDMELWLRIAQKYPVTYLDEQYTFVALEHDDRSVNVMKYNSGAEQFKLFQHIFDEGHSGTKISPEIKRHLLAGALHAMARYYIHRGQRLAAASAILRAMLADPPSAWFKLRLNVFIKLLTFTSMERVKGVIDYH